MSDIYDVIPATNEAPALPEHRPGQAAIIIASRRQWRKSMVKWNDPAKRDHGEIHDDLAMIVRDVTARGLPEPTSSGNWQITNRV